MTVNDVLRSVWHIVCLCYLSFTIFFLTNFKSFVVRSQSVAVCCIHICVFWFTHVALIGKKRWVNVCQTTTFTTCTLHISSFPKQQNTKILNLTLVEKSRQPQSNVSFMVYKWFGTARHKTFCTFHEQILSNGHNNLISSFGTNQFCFPFLLRTKKCVAQTFSQTHFVVSFSCSNKWRERIQQTFRLWRSCFESRSGLEMMIERIQNDANG